MAGAKAAHAVLLCEMERGSVTWENEDQIDRIRRAHAQKHVSTSKQSWGRADGRKPWFCKIFKLIHVLFRGITSRMGVYRSTYVPFA